MIDEDELAARFDAERTRLRAVAYRMLGSTAEADDAVQEAWLRLSRVDADGIDNLSGWLTTVVARVCLDLLRSRSARREEPWDESADDVADIDPSADPEREALLAESVGPAMLVVLETLAPAERLAFVLHDLFGVPFDEIAPVVGRTPVAARQLASRARRRVQGGGSTVDAADLADRRRVVDAFLAASRDGDFAGLLTVLDPDVVLHADKAAIAAAVANRAAGSPELAAELHGAELVAAAFSGRARAAQHALVDGMPGAAWVVDGNPRALFVFTISDGRVSAIELLSDSDAIRTRDVVLL